MLWRFHIFCSNIISARQVRWKRFLWLPIRKVLFHLNFFWVETTLVEQHHLTSTSTVPKLFIEEGKFQKQFYPLLKRFGYKCSNTKHKLPVDCSFWTFECIPKNNKVDLKTIRFPVFFHTFITKGQHGLRRFCN